MSRIVIALGALLAGLIVVPATPQVALADSGCPTAAVSYAGGTGTPGDPRLISTPGQLQRLQDDSVSGWDKSYLITADIDMGGCTWSRGIGTDARNFTGRLDGGGHVISGLDVSRVGSTELFVYAGLVTILGASGVVTRVGFTGDVTAIHSGTGDRIATAGGLVGFAYTNATVSFSYTTGDATAQGVSSDFGFGFARAGGLVGWTDGAVIRDSYATGSANTIGSMGAVSGGLVGLSTIGSITRGYSTGASTGTAPSNLSVGGFVGDVSSTLTGNLWDTTSSGTSAAAGSGTSTGITGRTGSQMRQFSTYNDSTWPIVNGWQPFDSAANKVWGICNGSTRAFLLWQYSANPCASTPGTPTITSVTPALTTASLAFTADDSGGATITQLEFALDDTTTVDDSTTNVSSPVTLSGLTQSTDYVVYMRAVNSQGPGPWSAPAAFRTQGRPGTPVVTGITPDTTTASVAFTADDSQGATILAIQFAIDDTLSIDGSTTNVSPLGLTGLSSGTAYTLYLRAVNANGPSPWSAGTSFTTLTPPPPPAPISPSVPLEVRATAGDRSVTAIWSAPATPGDYPVTNYQATATPGGRSCMATSTTCTIDGLTNGTAYTVTVRALSGGGWSAPSSPSAAVVPRTDDVPSLTITGARGSGVDRSMITVRGTSTGLAGKRATLWLSVGGRASISASATVVIKADGTFAWSRKLSRAVVIYAEAAGVRSNAVRLPSAR